MTIILDLPPDTEEQLRKSAADVGLTPEQYLLSLLEEERSPARLFPEGPSEEDGDFSESEREAFENKPMPTTPTEILKYWDRMGVHKSAPGGPDSPELAWKFRQDAESRNPDLSRQLNYSSSSTIVRQGSRPVRSQLLTRLKAEMDPGEELLWTGAPLPRRAMRSPLVLTSLACAAIMIGLLAAAVSLGDCKYLVFCLFPLPGLIFGLGYYLDARTNAQTIYGVSDRRALILKGGSELTVYSIQPHEIGQVNRKERMDGSGRVVFAKRRFPDATGDLRIPEVSFDDIPDVRAAERLLRTLSKAARD